MAEDRSGLADGAQAAYDAHAQFGVAARAPKARPEVFRQMTFAEFEAFLETVDETERFEWVRGQVVQQQAEQTRRHARLEQRIEQLLLRQLDGRAWQVLREYSVWTGSAYRITDLVVDPADADDQELRSTQPALIVEVTSRSSQLRDRVEKPAEYLTLDSLFAYIVVDQFSRNCLGFIRKPDGTFERAPQAFGDGETIRIDPLGVGLSIEDIYDGILDRDDDATD